MPEMAVIVPTRGRPENVQRVMEAWDFTNGWEHADLILVADADDPKIQEYRALVMRRQIRDQLPAPELIEVPIWAPMVHKLELAASDAAGRYWALGFAGDDHLPQTIGWAARYLVVLHELGTGMVYGDDGYQGARLSTEWAMTSDVVRALGRMVPAPVEHMFCDNAVLELFTHAGAVRHLPEVRIEHMHPYASKAEIDDQYKRVNSREQMNRDRRTFRSWQATTMASHVATVRALRAGHTGDQRTTRRPTRRPVGTTRQGRLMMKAPRFFRRVRAATPEDVMAALADFAAQVPGDQEIVEIGVFHGRTALQMAWGARQGGRAHVTAIDPWDLPGNDYGPPFTDTSTRRWAFHHVQTLGYSRDITLVQGFSVDAARDYDGPPVGLLFVDGDHSKAGARQDIESWAPHLAEGARIAVDDYGHPDWPGVKAAVDALVDEGVLEPVEVFHGALAVTRLATTPNTGRTTAVTSEGVHPSPDRDVTVLGSPDEPPAQTPDTEVSTHVPERTVVAEGELDGVAAGTSINDLTLAQLRALAKVREIVLGQRKDKKAEILAALRDGE